MSTEDTTKFQNTLWWIASIAVSVLCCSVLFILFASYLVEVKADVRDNNIRLTVVEEREDRILAELEAMRKHDMTPVQTPIAEPGISSVLPTDNPTNAQPAITGGPQPMDPVTPSSPSTPAVVSPPEAPATLMPTTTAAPTIPPAMPPVPLVTVPSISTPSENK